MKTRLVTRFWNCLKAEEAIDPENLYDIDVVQFKYKKGHFTNKEDPRYRKDMIGFIAEDVYEVV